eukprot:CAMPEP_0194133126 /NCGR_PEP_ID=MMETSP0152-20130528/3422_1 /TAXON_ID=1049557 /ORGANISM="Thalassiothrix antarctica, Strain L6-D1" /LENGTH=283 /DNA_ID=CAMNT_0038828377 /DNA_START=97 /DNA_END=948 /DNA_ORIENTATION=+
MSTLKHLVILFFLQQQCPSTMSFQQYSDGRKRIAGGHLASTKIVRTHHDTMLFSISDNSNPAGRRDVIGAFSLAALGVLLPSCAHAGDEEYKGVTTKISSKLLTSAETTAESEDALASINWKAPKVTGLSTEEMAKRIDTGLRRECWFVTGRSAPELFADSFAFSDPQVSLKGIEEYSRGVRSFYKQGSALGEIVCTAATGPDTITVVWRNYGTVNIGPGFDLAPYIVTTTLKTSANDGGLIVKQEDAFEVNNVALIKYNLFKGNRPPLPPIGSVVCPLPQKS